MKIGIIHTAFIGDIILTGLLLEGLHQANHEIIFFTKSKTSQILKNDQRISKVVILEKPKGIKKILAFSKMVQQIKAESLDILLCPHRSLTTTLCAYFSNVPQTIGFRNATLAILYDVKKPYDKNQHECLRYLALLSDIPLLCSQKTLDALKQLGRPILRPKPNTNLQPHIHSENKRYFVLALGSMWATKKYNSVYMQEICQSILETHQDLACYLTGDKNDMPLCENFIKNLSPQYQSRVCNTAGTLNLINFVESIKQATFVISNDSSPVHVASAFNIPTIVFFGPTIEAFGFGALADKRLTLSHETLFGHKLPCQPCNIHGANKCPKKHHLCMNKMTPDVVLPKIKTFLQSIL